MSVLTLSLFSYEDDAKLGSSKDEFRLLSLDPAPGSDYNAPLVCNISCHSIQSPPIFRALSYVWGSSQTPHSVQAGGKHLPITSSLDEALRHLRARGGEQALTLWIDQVCINQYNNDEKSDQVALMGSIYSAAERVLVWLGPAADGSDQVMEMFFEVGLAAKRLEWSSHMKEITRNLRFVGVFRSQGSGGEIDDGLGPFRQLIADCLPRFRELLGAIHEWMKRAWFTRIWVVQEFAMAKNSPAFVCGEGIVEAELVFLAMDVLLSAHGQLADAVRSDSSSQERKYLATILDDPTALFKDTRLGRQAFDLGIPGARATLLHVLRDTYVDNDMAMNATDCRDRVFALLGLASDSAELGLRADYTVRDYGIILARVAKALIRKTEGLEVLSYSQFPRQEYKNSQIPTWAPDWRSDQTWPLCETRTNHTLFSASGESPLQMYQTTNEKTLRLEGKAICTISAWVPNWRGFLLSLSLRLGRRGTFASQK